MNDVIDKNEFIGIVHSLITTFGTHHMNTFNTLFGQKIDDNTHEKIFKCKRISNYSFILTKIEFISIVVNYFAVYDNDSNIKSMTTFKNIIINFIDKYQLLKDICIKESNIYSKLKTYEVNKQKYHQIEQNILIF